MGVYPEQKVVTSASFKAFETDQPVNTFYIRGLTHKGADFFGDHVAVAGQTRSYEKRL